MPQLLMPLIRGEDIQNMLSLTFSPCVVALKKRNLCPVFKGHDPTHIALPTLFKWLLLFMN